MSSQSQSAPLQMAAENTSSTGATCDSAFDSNGNQAHARTAASNNPRPVAPQQTAATRDTAFAGVGSQFDGIQVEGSQFDELHLDDK